MVPSRDDWFSLPEHKWRDKPMSFHEFLKEIIETALTCEDIAPEEVTVIAIKSYRNMHGKPYGGAWLVSISRQAVKPTWRNNWATSPKIDAMIGILYSQGDFYPDLQ